MAVAGISSAGFSLALGVRLSSHRVLPSLGIPHRSSKTRAMLRQDSIPATAPSSLNVQRSQQSLSTICSMSGVLESAGRGARGYRGGDARGWRAGAPEDGVPDA
ncbi:MAG: hypothetical protein LBR80_13930 [Deltaproteobacteria bacterium]|jgi:hypothetical protein|nr:hypothetical protein [Deltaproteobacteria bacterium]